MKPFLWDAGSGCLDEPFQTTVHEQAFTYKGVKVRVKSTPNILSWKPAAGSTACCVELPTRRKKLPYDEILGVWQVPHARSCDMGLCPCGVVAVGGDGVFQECVMGLMEQRALGGSHLAAASRIRVGHIPGGSTDAVACSLHGTRCPETAALHVALGDRLPLDVANIACRPSAQEARGAEAAAAAMPFHSGLQWPTAGKANGTRGKGEGEEELLRHSASTTRSAGTGGSDTEKQAMWMGGPGPKHSSPSMPLLLYCRHSVLGKHGYDFAGFIQLVKLQSYRLQILYKPSAQSLRADAQDVCSYKCEVCRLAGLSMLDQAQDPCEPPSSGTPTKPGPGSAPRPPLPPSLSVPLAPTNPRTGQSPFAKGPRSPSPSRHGSSPSPTCIHSPSYQAPALGASPPISPSPAPIHLHHHHSMYASNIGKTSNATNGLPRGRSDSDLRGSSSRSIRELPAAASACGMGQAGPGLKGDSSPMDGLLSDYGEGSSNRGQDSSSPGKFAHSDGSASPFLGREKGHAGRGEAQRLLEESGVSSSNAQTGCCEGGMHRLHEHPDGGPLTESGWIATVGEYVSVMAVATPCRSDMTKRGIVPNGHLSDGRIYLILVSKCNRLDYLRFLIRLSSKGLEDNCFPFVKIIPVTSVVINPLPPTPTSPLYANLLGRCCPPPSDLHICSGESAWNVDGELLPHNAVRIGIMRGAVEVFARGVELVAPSL
ncbi:ATP-NAD kinase-like domain-containing protein [Dunaliella salina]|uniref:ATP-NAD kinase-like domain-containing protein n=1 Tax=Dunaliella salina TaxID=3046 RepID=A0ABQ7GU31_DUNSA|nr:ATP-NAD kinase-like domain-containing protein [Dunaliella salina]|eukprot:KAF5838128.1 ATP-NAD kinase-like domain-containing protein [Dunaliella salina]